MDLDLAKGEAEEYTRIIAVTLPESFGRELVTVRLDGIPALSRCLEVGRNAGKRTG